MLRRTGRETKVSIDGQWNDFRTPGDATQFELDSPIYLGGLGSSYNNVNSPPAVWTGTSTAYIQKKWLEMNSIHVSFFVLLFLMHNLFFVQP